MKINSAASAGGPGKLAYFTYFLWPLLGAELSISTLFSFLHVVGSFCL